MVPLCYRRICMLNSLRIPICVLALTFCAPALAKSWFHVACERILGAPRLNMTAQLGANLDSLSRDAYRINRSGRNILKTEVAELEWYKGSPVTAMTSPRLHASMEWVVTPPVVQVFFRPEFANQKLDDDSGHQIARSRAVVALIDDVQVTKRDGTVRRLSDLMADEARYIRERNKAMSAFEVRFATGASIDWMDLHSRHSGKVVVWLEGDLENFQVKRTLLLMMDVAFQELTHDRAFVREKPNKP